MLQAQGVQQLWGDLTRGRESMVGLVLGNGATCHVSVNAIRPTGLVALVIQSLLHDRHALAVIARRGGYFRGRIGLRIDRGGHGYRYRVGCGIVITIVGPVVRVAEVSIAEVIAIGTAVPVPAMVAMSPAVVVVTEAVMGPRRVEVAAMTTAKAGISSVAVHVTCATVQVAEVVHMIGSRNIRRMGECVAIVVRKGPSMIGVADVTVRHYVDVRSANGSYVGVMGGDMVVGGEIRSSSPGDMGYVGNVGVLPTSTTYMGCGYMRGRPMASASAPGVSAASGVTNVGMRGAAAATMGGVASAVFIFSLNGEWRQQKERGQG